MAYHPQNRSDSFTCKNSVFEYIQPFASDCEAFHTRRLLSCVRRGPVRPQTSKTKREARIGEITKAIPKAPGQRTDLKPSNSGGTKIDKPKEEVIKDMGFRGNQYQERQTDSGVDLPKPKEEGVSRETFNRLQFCRGVDNADTLRISEGII